MTRREDVSPLAAGLIALVVVACFVLAALSTTLTPARVRAQTTTPFLEGTANCTAVSFWFADGSYRLAQGKFYGLHPRLTLYNPQQVEQTVNIRIHSTQGSLVLQDVVAPVNRVVIDIGPLLGATADFSAEVEFTTLGAADLKIWSASTAYAPVMPLAVCR